MFLLLLFLWVLTEKRRYEYNDIMFSKKIDTNCLQLYFFIWLFAYVNILHYEIRLSNLLENQMKISDYEMRKMLIHFKIWKQIFTLYFWTMMFWIYMSVLLVITKHILKWLKINREWWNKIVKNFIYLRYMYNNLLLTILITVVI